MVTECADPLFPPALTLNVAVEFPRLRTSISPAWWKSFVNSSAPKLRFVSALVSRPFRPGTRVVATTVVLVAAFGCTSPPPPRRIENPVSCEASAVFTIAARIRSVSQPGCDCSVSAATPATCGEAMDVPEMNTPPDPIPTPVEKMLTPGPLKSGLRKPSPKRGPPEVKLAKARNPAFGRAAFVNMVEAAAATLAPSLVAGSGCCPPRTPRKGMVTLNCSPVSGLPVIGPSKGGRPPLLLIISTAAAPACCPKTARATRAQVPRITTASFPVTFAAMYSCLLQPNEIVPLAFLSTTMGSVLRFAGWMPFASIAVIVFPVESVSVSPGKDCVESTAAVLIGLSPDEGPPTMYGLNPALPAEVATMTPASTALFDA